MVWFDYVFDGLFIQIIRIYIYIDEFMYNYVFLFLQHKYFTLMIFKNMLFYKLKNIVQNIFQIIFVLFLLDAFFLFSIDETESHF